MARMTPGPLHDYKPVDLGYPFEEQVCHFLDCLGHVISLKSYIVDSSPTCKM